jgi:aspartate carbamoyltransferase regulatory subunit
MDDQAKLKHSKRLLQKESYIKKQLRIAKAYGIAVKEPHRLQDHSALTCGNPNCVMCANPRKVFKELTIQEKKFIEELKWQE